MNIRRMNRRVWSLEPSTRRVAFAWLACWIVALSGLQLQPLSPEAHGDEAPAGGKKLVVVAPSEFQASLAEFLAHKAKQLPTEWVALEEVLQGQTGVDDPEKLKRFLFQRWRDDHLGYALLVGDADVMPVRYMVLDRVTGCNTGSQPCAQTLLVGFAKALASAEQPRLGDAWAGAIRYYHAKQRLAELHPTADWYPPSIFFQGMKFMVFGDPTLLMPAP